MPARLPDNFPTPLCNAFLGLNGGRAAQQTSLLLKLDLAAIFMSHLYSRLGFRLEFILHHEGYWRRGSKARVAHVARGRSQDECRENVRRRLMQERLP
jgi:hypothetical protein